MMRTTLSIDDDVAAMLEKVRRDRETSLKHVINEALRRGLLEMNARRKPRKPYRTPSVDLGTPLMNIDNIAEVLAVVEGETFK